MDRVKDSHRAWKLEAQTVRSERTALLWAIQSWGLSLLTFLSFFPRLFHLQEYLFFPLLLLAIGTAWIDGTAIWSRSPIDLPLLLFIVWVLLTIPFAIDPAYSFQEWRKFLASALVFFWVLLVLQNITNNTILKVFLWTIVAGIIFQCSYGLIDFVVQGGSLKRRFVRATAPLSGFQELTTYMVMAIPLLIVTIVVSRTWWQRLISYGAVGLALLAQVLTYTRAGWLGMVAQGIGFGIFTKRPALRAALFVGFGLVSAALFLIFQLGYHQDTFDPWTLNARLVVWKLGFQEMLKQPIVGLGFGINTFEPRIEDLPRGGGNMHLHNTFLMIGVGSGWPALFLFIWVLVVAVRSLLSHASKVTDPLRCGIMVGAALMVIGFSVRNLFDFYV